MNQIMKNFIRSLIAQLLSVVNTSVSQDKAFQTEIEQSSRQQHTWPTPVSPPPPGDSPPLAGLPLRLRVPSRSSSSSRWRRFCGDADSCLRLICREGCLSFQPVGGSDVSCSRPPPSRVPHLPINAHCAYLPLTSPPPSSSLSRTCPINRLLHPSLLSISAGACVPA